MSLPCSGPRVWLFVALLSALVVDSARAQTAYYSFCYTSTNTWATSPHLPWAVQTSGTLQLDLSAPAWGNNANLCSLIGCNPGGTTRARTRATLSSTPSACVRSTEAAPPLR